MRTRHRAGCVCDQTWYHQKASGDVRAARRYERDRMDAAREVGKTMSNLARERRIGDTGADPPGG